MQLAEELSVPQVATYLKVNEGNGSTQHSREAPFRDSPWDPMVR